MAGDAGIEGRVPVAVERLQKGSSPLVALVVGVELASAMGLADMDPVGRSVVTSLKARSLARQAGLSMALFPVLRQLALNAGQHV